MTKNIAKYLLAILSLSVVYLTMRLSFLDSLPVFGDEAIYLRWSQLIRHVDTLRFVPQTDGKQPLFMWLSAIAFSFIHDPLLAGRFLSVIFGLITAIFLSLTFALYLNFQKSSKNPLEFIANSINQYYSLSLIPFVVYLFIPFAFFFDRLALPDNLLTSLSIISAFFTFLLIKFPRLDLAFILGAVLGLSWLTKSPAIYFVAISAFSFILLNRLKKIYYPLISGIIAFLIYNILRLGPQFHQLAQRNWDYVWSPLEIIKHPLDPFLPHLKDLIVLYVQYLSLPILLLLFSGVIFALINRQQINRQFLLLLSYYLLPLVVNLAFSRVFTGRYLLYTNPFFILLFSLSLIKLVKYALEFFQSKLLISIFIVLCFTPNIFWLFKVATNPYSVKLPTSESGYVENWTAGWGIKSVAEYLIGRSYSHNVIVGTEGYFGTLPDGLQIYTNQIPFITVFGVDLSPSEIPAKLIDAKNHGDDVYLLLNSTQGSLSPSARERLKLIIETVKPDNTSLILYQLL